MDILSVLLFIALFAVIVILFIAFFKWLKPLILSLLKKWQTWAVLVVILLGGLYFIWPEDKLLRVGGLLLAATAIISAVSKK